MLTLIKVGLTYIDIPEHNELEDTLVATGIGNGDRFGISVSLNANGNRLAIGASRDVGVFNAISNQGATYLFDYDNSAWTQTQVLRATTAWVVRIPLAWGLRCHHPATNWRSLDMANKLPYFLCLTDGDANTWQSTETYVNPPRAPTICLAQRSTFRFNGKEAVVGAYYDDSEFQGVVANSDHDTDFDRADSTSTGTATR